MPRCKNCGARLEKFDKDMCPVCGTPNPFGEAFEDTSTIPTADIRTDSDVIKNYKPKTKNQAFLFSLLLGFFGGAFFYIKRIKLAFLTLAISLIFLGVLFSLFYFAFSFEIWLAILIPILFALIFNILSGLLFLYKNDIKDGEGNLLY